MNAREPDGERVRVDVPDEPPVLNARSSCILLAILVELTEVKMPDGPGGEGDT